MLIGGMLFWWQLGGRVLSVESGSMTPIFKAGDALLVQRVSAEQLRVGDVAVYRSPRNGRQVLSHRVIAIDYTRQRLHTKGDALPAPDDWIGFGLVGSKAWAVAPHLGQVLSWLRQPWGLVVVLYIPACLVLGLELRRLQIRGTPTRQRPLTYRLK